MTDARRALPSVGALLESGPVRELLGRAPRSVVVDAVRAAVDAARSDPRQAPRDDAGWAAAIESGVAMREKPSLQRVINATGIILHTNLGRAPLAQVAIDAIVATAGGFTNLEYDLDEGVRGSRTSHCLALLKELTGAEDALVVNNGAGALVLALHALAAGREAIVSRGELVEIGGSFRIPDIMARSGARLREVGTTNRTHLSDYRAAIGPDTGALIKVHRSNFAVEGFVAEVGVPDLAPLASEHALPIIHDLGSGLLIPLDAYGLTGEPTAAEAIRQGADIVLMSGDKLLGGPQAGIVVGRARAVAALRSNPLARALRVDKLTLAALEATLALYREPARALEEVPALAMLSAAPERIRRRADRLYEIIVARGFSARVIESHANVGGGAFPTARIPSSAVDLMGDAMAIEKRLRAGSPPVIARIVESAVRLDMRGVLQSEDELLSAAVLEALA
jgi:L-seryl-tRNA(Ser) seleniumtransferase